MENYKNIFTNYLQIIYKKGLIGKKIYVDCFFIILLILIIYLFLLFVVIFQTMEFPAITRRLPVHAVHHLTPGKISKNTPVIHLDIILPDIRYPASIEEDTASKEGKGRRCCLGDGIKLNAVLANLQKGWFEESFGRTSILGWWWFGVV